jgi:two-component system NtrC family sensor kinase
MPMESPYRRLRRQMLTVLLLFGLVPLLAIGVAGFLADKEEVESRTRRALEVALLGRKVVLERFLEARLDTLALAADSRPSAALATSEGLERVQALLKNQEGGLVDLALLDDGGGTLAYIGPYGPNPPGLDARGLEEVRVLGRHQSDVFLGLGRFPHLTLAVAKREGGALFLLKATLDAQALGALLAEGPLDAGTQIFVLDRSGKCQAHCGPLPPLADPGIGPLSVHPGVRFLEATRDGHPELLAATWLRHDRWVIVARHALPTLPQRIVAHPVVLAAFLACLLSVPPLSFLVARYRLRQIKALEAEHAALLESVAQTQKMATIGRLAATVAHEINNPLSVMHAQLGVVADCLAAEETPLAKDLLGRIKKIEAQIVRGGKVTHRLLSFSRRVGPDLAAVDVQAALEEAVGFVEKESEAAGTRIVRDYQLDMPTIRSSLSQMQQVFLNLINNAVDATGGGGEVVLTIRGADEGVLVSVSDNGPGIAEGALRHIFEPFHSTKSGDHAGLGLALCRELMQNLGGQIDVVSPPGQGTTFTLKFPLASPEGAPTAAGPKP